MDADIVGRDLNLPGFNGLGHVGIWTGNMVVEALSQTPAININTIENFKNQSPYWGAVYFTDWATLPPVKLNVYGDTYYTFMTYQGRMDGWPQCKEHFSFSK